MLDESQDRSIVGPVGVWWVVLLLPLMLSAARVPLSHRFVVPPESAAVEVMVVAQIVFGALLAPFLFRDRASSLAVVASGVPLLLGAALLADVPVVGCWRVGLYLFAWTSSLALLNHAVRGRAFPTIVLSGWAVGGVVLDYLRSEFSPGRSGESPNAHILWSPIHAAIILVSSDGSNRLIIWAPVVGILLLAALLSLVRTRQLIHRDIPRVG